MRYMRSDLAILNAEQYDDGGRFPRSGLTRRPQPVPSVDDGSGPRKRLKTQRSENAEKEDEDESKKRARGRPRLDTKDETAADVSGRRILAQPYTRP